MQNEKNSVGNPCFKLLAKTREFYSGGHARHKNMLEKPGT